MAVDPKGASDSFSPAYYWSAFRRRWILASVTILAVLVTHLLFVYSRPRVYEASVDILIAPESWGEVFLRDQGAKEAPPTSFDVYLDHARGEACIGRVIAGGALGPPPPPRTTAWLDRYTAIEGALTATRLSQHRVARLSVRWGEAEMAQRLANDFAEAYLETVGEAKVAVGRAMERYIDTEVVRVQAEISALRSLLMELDRRDERSADSGGVTLDRVDRVRGLLQERMGEVERLLAAHRAVARAARARGEGPDPSALMLQSSRLLEAVPSGFAGPYVESERLGVESVRAKMTETLGRRDQIARTYTALHPERVAATLAASEAGEALLEKTLAWARIAQSGIEDRARAAAPETEAPHPVAAVLFGETIPLDATSRTRFAHELQMRESLLERLVSRRVEIQLSRTGQEGAATWIRPAARPHRPVSPRFERDVIPGLMLGVLCAVAAVIAVDRLDSAVRAPEQLSMQLGVQSLAVIPNIPKGSPEDPEAPLGGQLVMSGNALTPAAEAFRGLARRVIASRLQVIGLTSTGPQEGKSTASANLAAALAETGKKVLLCSFNLRRPTLHDIVGARLAPGIAEIAEGSPWAPCVVPTKIPGLHFLPSGERTPAPAAVLSSELVRSALAQARVEFDYVILDFPPCLPVADPLILADRVEAFLIMCLMGRTKMNDFQKTIESIESVGGKVLGAILNDARGEGRYYYRYGYYGYVDPDASS